MRITRLVMLLCLVVVCVLGKKGRVGRRLRRRCGCKAVLSNINSLIDKKLTAFRDELVQSTVPLPESTRAKFIDHKLKSLSADVSGMRAGLRKHDVMIRDTSKQIAGHRTLLVNVSHKISRLEMASRNMTSVLSDMARFVTSDRRRNQEALSGVSGIVAATPHPGYPKDCDEVYKSGGLRYKGEYYIFIQPQASPKPFKVLCHNSNNSGWAVIQRREEGDTDFRRTWDEYKRGFGPLSGDFWLGNDKLHYLTATENTLLRVELGDWRGNRYYAEYDEFSVANEPNLYKLHISGYHGNAGDSLSGAWRSHDGQPFSTRDRDNDKRYYDNCAQHYSGAWWFTDCFESHLNGKFYGRGNHNNYFARDGIHWKSIHPYESLKYTIMMTRTKRVDKTVATQITRRKTSSTTTTTTTTTQNTPTANRLQSTTVR